MARLLDLHVHPSLKMYYLPYLRASFHARVLSGPFRNPLSFRTQYSHLKNSPVKIMLCAHYVIEQDFVKHGIQGWARAVSWIFAPLFYGKLRREDPYKALNGMMDTLEKAAANTNRWVFGNGTRFKLVRRFAELQDLGSNEIALVHAIEGAHALGYHPEPGQSLDDFMQQTLKRLKEVKERGVCLITLAHFWDNMFAPQTNGTELVPKRKNGEMSRDYDDLMAEMKRADWEWGDKQRLAEPFARACLEMGMLIDISHTQEHARWRIYELCESYDRPVIASHVGLRHFFNHEYNLSDDEVLRIHKLGGIVGLILSRRWLVDPLKHPETSGNGIDDLIENMLYIRNLTGDVSCIGIGTDFDGLTDPFDDCYHPGHLDRVAEAMRKHFTEGEIDQILYGNSLRALERGWD